VIRLDLRDVFRWLIVISTLAYLVLFFTPAIPLQLSAEVLVFRAQSGYGATLPAVAWFPYAFLVAFLIANAGLFFFQIWARTVFLALYVLVLILRFVQGITVQLPLENFLGEVVALADGAILALSFSSPLTSYFRRQQA